MRRSCMSRRMPLVMARAMMSAATPAVTPAMEMPVTTPTTACRRLALRYRAATMRSNRIYARFSSPILFRSRAGDYGFGYAHVFAPVVDANSDEVFPGFAFKRLGWDLEVVVLAFGVRELADWIDVLPRACVDGVLGVGNGRG